MIHSSLGPPKETRPEKPLKEPTRHENIITSALITESTQMLGLSGIWGERVPMRSIRNSPGIEGITLTGRASQQPHNAIASDQGLQHQDVCDGSTPGAYYH